MQTWRAEASGGLTVAYLKAGGEQVSGGIPKAAYCIIYIKTSLDKNQNQPWRQSPNPVPLSTGRGCNHLALAAGAVLGPPQPHPLPPATSLNGTWSVCSLTLTPEPAEESWPCPPLLRPEGASQASVLGGSAWPQCLDLSTEERKLEVPKYLLLVKKLVSCGLAGWRRGEVMAHLALHFRLGISCCDTLQVPVWL